MASYDGFAKLERDGWTDKSISRGYAEMFSSASNLAIPSIVSEVRPGARVLDLCCGQANVSEALLQAGFSVVGADFSSKMLALARERLPDGEFVEADAQDLPFEDGDFDTVVCSFGMMHIPDQPQALREVRRVLNEGGQFLMTSWCGPEDRYSRFSIAVCRSMATLLLRCPKARISTNLPTRKWRQHSWPMRDLSYMTNGRSTVSGC